MPKFMESIAIINSSVRTILGVAIVGGLGIGGWYGYKTYNAKDLAIEEAEQQLVSMRGELEKKSVLLKEKDDTIESLNVEVQKKQKEIERLDTAMRLLKVDHRVARLTVLDQVHDPDSDKVVTRLEFQELDDQAKPIDAPKQFDIPGDVVYVDSWVVKFDDKYVEAADLHRSTSLVLFRRAFGEHQKPLDGVALDEVGGRPKVYGRSGDEMPEFESKIWRDFWSVANDEAKQKGLGIRAAHGEAPSIKVQKGKAYRVELRASGGLTITPDGDAPMNTKKPAA
jgi:hypothetical protein